LVGSSTRPSRTISFAQKTNASDEGEPSSVIEHQADPPRPTWKAKALLGFLLFACAVGAFWIAEYLILPWKSGLPREFALLGFASTAKLVDDTPINRLGFTGDVPDLQKDPATRRILTLGGSAFFNRRTTERLKKHISQKSNQPIEIVGAALRTHTTRASLLKYQALSKYKFDYVLIYHGINDLWANDVRSADFRADYSHLNPWYHRSALLDSSLVARSIYNWFYEHRPNAFKDFLAQSPRASVNGANYRSVETFESNLRQLLELIRADGAIPVLMTFAWMIPENYSEESFQAGALGYVNPEKYDLCPVKLWGPVAFVREGLRRHEGVVRKLAKEMNVLLLDQKQLMGDRIELFGDVCHFNEPGTEQFVEHITDFLLQNGFDRAVGTTNSLGLPVK
jgi:lysophospholipase L1-like esterase